MELMEAMEARRSTRRYRPKPLPEEIIETILRAGYRAPSAGNRQQLRVVVSRDRAAAARASVEVPGPGLGLRGEIRWTHRRV